MLSVFRAPLQVWIYKESGEPLRRVSDAELPWSAMIKEIRRGKEAAEFSVECESLSGGPPVGQVRRVADLRLRSQAGATSPHRRFTEVLSKMAT